MNDYFASDSLDNWRKPDYLTKNEKKYYLKVKFFIVTLLLLLIKDLSLFLIVAALLSVYVLHNSLIKKYRFFSFVLLRILKMLPFFLLPKFSLVLFLYFSGYAILEGITSYKKSKKNMLPIFFSKVVLVFLFWPSIRNILLVLSIQLAPKIFKNGFRLFGN